jgi:elongation factor Tu
VLHVGDTVYINGGPAVRVDGIEMFRKSIDEAKSGDNIGVLFKDVEKSQLDRRAVLTAPGGASDAGSSAFIV